jgi:hypothetical protein
MADIAPIVDHLAITLAGEVSGLLFGSRLPWPSRSDRANAAKLLDGFSADEREKLLVDAVDRARDILVAHRDDVMRLAEHLLMFSEIDGAEVERIIGEPASPPMRQIRSQMAFQRPDLSGA